MFGGSIMTATDVAVAAGLVHLGNADHVAHIRADAPQILEVIAAPLRRAVQRAGSVPQGGPVVLIGGSVWLAAATLGSGYTVIPEHHAAANAVGAATAAVSGDVDRLVSLEGVSRREALAEAVSDAVHEAVSAGADPASVRVAWAEDAPLTYLPGNVTRVRVKAFGALAAEVLRGR